MNKFFVNDCFKYFIFILIFYLIGCSSGKETRYEQKPNPPKAEAKKEIEIKSVTKTMEVRERELIKKLKISAVDRISFEYDSKGKLVNKGKISTVKYDKKGLLTETTTFDPNGRVQNRYEYKYDKNGFRIESLRYDAQNKADKKYIYEYDKAGIKIKSTRYDMKGKTEKYYLYDYDSNINLISDEWYDASGDLEYKIETEYDDDGNKTVSFSYAGDGKLNFKYVFKYDDKKNIIEEKKYDSNDKLVGITQYLYKYY